MDENMPGDRTSLCELLGAISILGDDEYLRLHWTEGDWFNAFVSYMGVIFDDFDICRRSEMEPGYLGSPRELPKLLRELAVKLDEFDRAHPETDRQSDLELLEFPEWNAIRSTARAIWAATQAWRISNCAS